MKCNDVSWNNDVIVTRWNWILTPGSSQDWTPADPLSSQNCQTIQLETCCRASSSTFLIGLWCCWTFLCVPECCVVFQEISMFICVLGCSWMFLCDPESHLVSFSEQGQSYSRWRNHKKYFLRYIYFAEFNTLGHTVHGIYYYHRSRIRDTTENFTFYYSWSAQDNIL